MAGRIALIILILIIVVVLGMGLWYLKARGMGTRASALPFEKAVAHAAVDLSYPSDAKTKQNPLQNTPDNVKAGLTHYAHDCAFCHGADGKGKTEAASGMFPPIPDMTDEADMTDGELYYIIKNGIRFSGMPAWNFKSDDRYWNLVVFIRHLPQMTPDEVQQVNQILHPGRPAEGAEHHEEGPAQSQHIPGSSPTHDVTK